mmetsp:Transcript_1005/g.2389  ORF Transcript_1005/g.2389 Transcript_1005/m.2389 type:complete len:313 (+) Transcript_1005:683-1621(+)
MRRERAQDDGPQQARGVVIVLGAVLYEAPAVHIADVALTLLAPEQVKATNLLAKRKADDPGNLLLMWAQQNRESDLLPIGGTLNAAVNHGRLPRLRVRVARPHSVHLHVRPAGRKEDLVDVGAVAANGPRMGRVIVSALVVHLPEQLLHAAAHRVRVVDVDVVVLAVHRLLDKRLVDLEAVHYDVVLGLLKAFRVLPRLGLLRSPLHHDMLWDAHAVLHERLVHEPAVKEDVLRGEVVHEVRAPQQGVRLGLVEWEPLREPREQALHDRPPLHRLVDDALIAEVDDFKFPRSLQPGYYLSHRPRVGLFVHCT